MAPGKKGVLTPERLHERVATVQVDRSHGGRAPHKPLLLLLALGLVKLGPERRLIPYKTAEELFKQLWNEFGRPGGRPRVEYPFGRLRNDDRLWEIPKESQLSTGRKEEIKVDEAKRLGITGGFQQDIHDLLFQHPEIVSRTAQHVLSDHFPPTIHRDILEAVQIAPCAPGPLAWEYASVPGRAKKVRKYTPRDPRFRRNVLEAYGDRCAVCGHDIRFGNRVLGLEAAHIRWHSHNGRDVVPNGLALCSVHHKALDAGALGLDSKGGSEYRILISRKVSGRSPAATRLRDFSGKPVRPPVRSSNAPDRRFVEWHRMEVFHP